MKISHATVLITFLFYIDLAFPETPTIEIKRLLPGGKLDKWKEVKDSFTIPFSVCNDQNSGYGNYCNDSCDLIPQAGNIVYSCECTGKHATATYLDNRWTCLKNEDARTRLGCEDYGEENNLLFHDEKKGDKLRTLNTAEERKLRDLDSEDDSAKCTLNISSSWYIGCFGEKVKLGPHPVGEEIFHLQRDDDDDPYYIQVDNPINTDFLGRVINLGISCSGSTMKEGCLLFKLEGTLTCPAERPITTSTIVSSTINPTMSSSYLEVASPSIANSGKASSSTTIGPSGSQAITPPSNGRKRKNAGDNPSSSPGIIAGVTSSVILVLLLIAAFFIYRRRKTRKEAHASTSGQTVKKTAARNSKTNSTFQLEEQNGSVTNHDKKSSSSAYSTTYTVPQQQMSSEENSQSGGLYAALDVPEGHNIYGHTESQKVVSQNGFSVEQPVYNVLEDLSVKDSEESANNDHQPEPVYNVLEDPYAEVPEEPAWYGSTPVDNPVYNILEDPNQYTGCEPVYNVLEEPEQSGTGEDDSYGPSGLQDPVYNVLEGPDSGIK